MELYRAYAVVDVQPVDLERRTIRGVASTATLDRQGHIVDPRGARFTNPIPLLFHHDQAKPIGVATLAAGPDVITFEASLPVVTEPGTVRDRVDEAWHSITAGLIRGVSIGYRPTAKPIVRSKAVHLPETEILELSLVTIPANVDATIHAIKSYDAPHLAAFGLESPGVSGLPIVRVKDARPMKPTTQEQITQWENKRAAHSARMGEIMTKAGEAGTTLDEAQTEEYDGLALELKSIDDHLVRLRALEKTNAAAAAAIVPAAGLAPRSVSVRPNVEPGTAFIRAACAKLVCKGNVFEAAEYAKRWDDSTPEVALWLKAAVAPGTSTDATWAKPLVGPGNTIVEEFLTLLRPATILGRISGFNRVPFNATVPMVTAGGTYSWVGEAKPKPVTRMTFGSTALPVTKSAGIMVLSEELVRLSNPSAEAVVRREMIAGIAAFLDIQFINPAVAEVAGVNPASITNGVTPVTGTADPEDDLKSLLGKFTTAGLPLSGLTLIMSSTNALALSFLRNPNGTPVFPNMTVSGGNVAGIGVVVSDAAGDDIVAVLAPYILYADDGGVTVDVSREASVQMDSAPASPPDATTVLVSLWQNNLVGLRAERFINWKKGHAQAAQYIDGAAY